MSDLVRFGVCLEKKLLAKFDKYIKSRNYNNRSQAIGDLITNALSKDEWQENRKIFGAIILVYNHHQRELVNRLIDVQHHSHDNILSTQHLHINEDICMEIVSVKGITKEIKKLFYELKSLKGIKYATFAEIRIENE